MMLWAALGGMIVLVPLFYTTVNGKPAWKDPIRVSILGTWILTFIATPIQGFYIEFQEATLSGGPTDVVFGDLQYFALIGIPLVCMGLLAIDFYQDKRSTRSAGSAFAIFGTLIAVVSAYTFVYFTATSPAGPAAWVFGFGLLLMDLFLLFAMVAVYFGNPEKIEMVPSDGGSFAAVPRRERTGAVSKERPS
jgi:hypothetical protein